jgi:hypothetical protein
MKMFSFIVKPTLSIDGDQPAADGGLNRRGRGRLALGLFAPLDFACDQENLAYAVDLHGSAAVLCLAPPPSPTIREARRTTGAGPQPHRRRQRAAQSIKLTCSAS